MEYSVILRPGTPNDDNREYLPEAIKNSDMVVNENGNNSQPYPVGLREVDGCLADDLPDRWYEYVPKSYDGSRKVPLVLGIHGGLMTGWGHAIYTSWTMLADREGFICVFPDAHAMRIWQVEGMFEGFDAEKTPDIPINKAPDDYRENHDLNFLLALIEEMKHKYAIDETRIFMQGMSNGNLMTAQFLRYYGNILAGAAGSGGPTQLNKLFTDDDRIMNQAGPVAVWQARPEKNGTPPGRPYGEPLLNRFNRFYWMYLNKTDLIPKIKIEGEHNYAFYEGKAAPLVYHDIKNRDHGQTLDEAFLYWDYLFSGLRRMPDGSICQSDPLLPRENDRFAISVTAGAANAWLNGQIVTLSTPVHKWQKLKYHGLNGGVKVRGEYLCVSLSFLAKVFHAEYIPSGDTLSAAVKLADGRTLQFARGSIGCAINGNIRSMYCEALHRNGELLVSIEWFCQYLFNLHVSACDDVVYVTDHFAQLSMNMADLIKEMLYGKLFPDNFRYMEYEELEQRQLDNPWIEAK